MGGFESQLDFVGFAEVGGAFRILRKFLGGFILELRFFAALQGAKPMLIAAAFPALDVLVKKAGMAEFFEFGDDFVIGKAVVEHLVDELADFFGEAGDFAGATTLWRGRQIYD